MGVGTISEPLNSIGSTGVLGHWLLTYTHATVEASCGNMHNSGIVEGDDKSWSRSWCTRTAYVGANCSHAYSGGGWPWGFILGYHHASVHPQRLGLAACTDPRPRHPEWSWLVWGKDSGETHTPGICKHENMWGHQQWKLQGVSGGCAGHWFPQGKNLLEWSAK